MLNDDPNLVPRIIGAATRIFTFYDGSIKRIIDDKLDNKELQDKITISFWKGDCYRCFNKIEYPLLNMFSYGEDLYQTTDGKDFYYARFLDNPVMKEVENVLKGKKYTLRKILIQIADKPGNKSFTTKNALCPICGKSLWVTPVDNVKTSEKILNHVTWTNYLGKDLEERKKMIEEAFKKQ
jgi:hypothetical protein